MEGRRRRRGRISRHGRIPTQMRNVPDVDQEDAADGEAAQYVDDPVTGRGSRQRRLAHWRPTTLLAAGPGEVLTRGGAENRRCGWSAHVFEH